MKKQAFIDYLTQYQSISDGALEELKALSVLYPYAQSVLTLMAKSAHEAGNTDALKFLHQASIHTSERSRLKEIISQKAPEGTQGRVVESHNYTVENEPLPGAILPAAEEEVTHVDQASTVVSDAPAAHVDESTHEKENSLYADLEHNMKIYKQQRESLDRDEKSPAVQDERTSEGEGNSVEQKEVKSLSPADAEFMADYLENLKKNKKKILIEDEKQKEQIRLINRFIKKSPRLQKLRAGQEDIPEEREDLSIPKLRIGEDLVSENLALILKKQGKKEKAIDIYKKLIWQYPEKKAYFADRIEELKNT